MSTINEMCLNCTKETCNGLCEELQATMGAVKRHGDKMTLTWNGVTRSVSEWADILGITRQALYQRIRAQESIDDILTATFNARYNRRHSGLHTEEVYRRLITMHLDYDLIWNKGIEKKESLGLVTKYGRIITSPTNKTTNTVEELAMPELTMSDHILEKRAWVALVIYLIQLYKSTDDKQKKSGLFKAHLLEERAFKGKSLRKIMDDYKGPLHYKASINTFRHAMDEIVDDIIDEALRRGLLVEHRP